MKKPDYLEFPDTSNLLDWLGEALALKDEERQEIVDSMLQSYVKILADDDPAQLDALVLFLKESKENRKNFKQSLNNINLIVAMSFMVDDETQYNQVVRRILMACRQDSIYSKKMIFYYLNNLDQDNFKGIVENEADFALIVRRLAFFRENYENVVP